MLAFSKYVIVSYYCINDLKLVLSAVIVKFSILRCVILYAHAHWATTQGPAAQGFVPGVMPQSYPSTSTSVEYYDAGFQHQVVNPVVSQPHAPGGGVAVRTGLNTVNQQVGVSVIYHVLFRIHYCLT